MLVLERGVMESIMVGDDVQITILSVQTEPTGDGVGRKSVKLGIVAPREVKIHRQEVYERIKESVPGQSQE